MFGKLRSGEAICLSPYRDIQSGAIVPPVNELWAQVEEWVGKNGWAPYDEPEPQKPKEKTALELAKLARARAYADLETGSDVHFNEVKRKRAQAEALREQGDTEGASIKQQEARQADLLGLARAEEIQAQYPLPE